ncbi:DedA family protein [Deinococcus pimensis]|uniref:DedA family protein n=1 Tax=Deinococcus pimensis TaxID=309888 RepID=UPI0004BAA58A|nr:VTT domain-containing protein [Deinococcus pimensis]
MDLAGFATWLGTLPPGLVHLVLFVLLLVEGIGVPGIPFELVWLAEGFLINAGRTSMAEAILWGALGNWIGNLIGYLLGDRIARLLPPRARGAMNLDEVRGWLDRWGGLVVIVSRWFGVIRTPFILYAGAAGMPLGRYAFFSAIGALTWVAAWQVALWWFGEIVLKLWARYQWWIVAAAVAAAVLGFVVMGLRGRRASRAVPQEAPEEHV